MLSKNTLKYLRSLKLKKNRDREDKVVVEGSRIIIDLLRQRSAKVHRIFLQEKDFDKFKLEFPALHDKIKLINQKELKAISAFLSAPDMILLCDKPKPISKVELNPEAFYIYLDKLQDPGNAGTIYRTAEWFGVQGIFYSGDSVKPDNPKLIQSSMGAIFRMPFKEISFEELDTITGSIPAIGTFMQGQNIFAMDKPSNGIIVIGNEGNGISQEIEENISLKVTIPPHRQNQSESLNAGIAAAIVMAQFCQK